MWDMVKAAAPLIGMVSFKDKDGDEEAISEGLAASSAPDWKPDPGFMAKLRASQGASD